MDKSPDAFRTISEVAETLGTPAHVLRFWEGRFPQIKPVKRAGGRRYYRPADVALLAGIKRLLHDEGLTIRGVQKILRDQGVRHVAGLSDDSVQVEDLEAADVPVTPEPAVAAPQDPPRRVIAVRVAAPEPEPLPLFEAAQAPEPTPAPPAPRPRTLRDDVTPAAQIRALPLGALSGAQPDLGLLAQRLATLRARYAARIDGSLG